MSEHWCKDCKNDGDNRCKFTGVLHTTGIECPSFGPKEVKMFKIGDKVRVTADKEKLNKWGIPAIRKLTGVEGEVFDLSEGDAGVDFGLEYGGTWWLDRVDLELIEPTKWKDSGGTGPPIRTFETGATRDTAQGKLDYVKALSPIVLRRYVQYLDKHRLQSDGSYRDFDNWKKGMDQEVYRSSNGRHFFDDWLLTEGYAIEDNHGPVTDIEDVICAKMFNDMGRLHEIVKARLADESK